MPEVPSVVSAVPVASTEDTAEKHQTEPTKPNITLEQESEKTVERTAPENDPVESQPIPKSSNLEESSDDTSSKLQEALAPVLENKPVPSKRRRHILLWITAALFTALIIVLIISVVVMNSAKIDFTVDMKARFEGNRTWNEELYHARVGDVVQLQASFLNDRGTLGTIMGSVADRLGMSFTADDVIVTILLPDNLEYIPGSTILINSNHPDGLHVEIDDVVATGINIGAHSINGKSFVRISCRIVDKGFEVGENWIVPFVKATVAGVVRHDDGVPICLVY